MTRGLRNYTRGECAATDASVDPRRIESPIIGPDDRDYARYGRPDAQVKASSSGRAEDLSSGSTGRERQPELMERKGPHELRGPDGPRNCRLRRSSHAESRTVRPGTHTIVAGVTFETSYEIRVTLGSGT